MKSQTMTTEPPMHGFYDTDRCLIEMECGASPRHKEWRVIKITSLLIDAVEWILTDRWPTRFRVVSTRTGEILWPAPGMIRKLKAQEVEDFLDRTRNDFSISRYG